MTTEATRQTRKLMKLVDAHGNDRADPPGMSDAARTAASRSRLRAAIHAALQRAHQAGRESTL